MCVRLIKNVKMSPCRYPDVIVGTVDDDAVAHEVKAGRGTKAFTLRQVQRDVLLRNRGAYKQVVWHFYVSGISGKLGPSEAVLDALDAADIPYYVHLPKDGSGAGALAGAGETL